MKLFNYELKKSCLLLILSIFYSQTFAMTVDPLEEHVLGSNENTIQLRVSNQVGLTCGYHALKNCIVITNGILPRNFRRSSTHFRNLVNNDFDKQLFGDANSPWKKFVLDNRKTDSFRTFIKDSLYNEFILSFKGKNTLSNNNSKKNKITSWALRCDKGWVHFEFADNSSEHNNFRRVIKDLLADLPRYLLNTLNIDINQVSTYKISRETILKSLLELASSRLNSVKDYKYIYEALASNNNTASTYCEFKDITISIDNTSVKVNQVLFNADTHGEMLADDEINALAKHVTESTFRRKDKVGCFCLDSSRLNDIMHSAAFDEVVSDNNITMLLIHIGNHWFSGVIYKSNNSFNLILADSFNNHNRLNSREIQSLRSQLLQIESRGYATVEADEESAEDGNYVTIEDDLEYDPFKKVHSESVPEEAEQDQRYTVANIPESIKEPMPVFTTRLEKLVPVKDKSFSLEFNPSTGFNIVEYLYGNSKIARFIQVGGVLNFQKLDSNKYNFSLINQLRAFDLKADINGQFSFEQPVSLVSTDIKCDSLNINDEFSVQHIIFFFPKFMFNNSGKISSGCGLFIDAPRIINDGELRAKTLVCNSYDILLSDESKVVADDAYLRALLNIKNEGYLGILRNLFAHSSFVTNAGRINARDIFLKADKYLWNTTDLRISEDKLFLTALKFVLKPFLMTLGVADGSIIADNAIMIDAIVIANSLGIIKAPDVTVNSGLNFNIGGIYVAKDTKVNSVIDCNLGLYLPGFETEEELKERAKKEKWFIGLGIASKFCPAIGTASFLFKQAYATCTGNGVPQQAMRIYRKVQELRKKENTCASDWIAVIVEAKNTGSTAFQLGKIVVYEPLKFAKAKYDATKEKMMAEAEKKASSSSLDGVNTEKTPANIKAPSFSEVVETAIDDTYEETAQAIDEKLTYWFKKPEDNIADSTAAKSSSEITTTDTLSVGDTKFAVPVNTNPTPTPTPEKPLWEKCKGYAKSFWGRSKECAKENITPANCARTGLQVASSVVSSLGPQLNRDSVVDINVGVQAGVNHSSRSVFNLNTGVSVNANTSTVSTVKGVNSGVIAASDLSISAAQKYTSSGAIGGGSVAMTATDLDVEGKLGAIGTAKLKAHNKADLNADISAHDIAVEAFEISMGENSDITARDGDAHFKADIIGNQGKINAKKRTGLDGRLVALKQGSDINAGQVVVKATAQLTREAGSSIKSETTSIDAKIDKGEAGNVATSTNCTYVTTELMDNKGTTNGPLVVDFKGTADQFVSIGNVDHLQCQGIIPEGVADKIAEGNGDFVKIADKGSATIIAGTQDVHLQKRHDMNHSFNIVTEGDITTDEPLTSKESIGLSGKDIKHSTIDAEKSATLIAKEKTSSSDADVRGNEVYISTKTLDYSGTRVHSGKGGSTIIATDGGVARAIERKSGPVTTTITNPATGETTTVTETKTENQVCEFTSDAKTILQTNGKFDLYATKFGSPKGTVIIGKGGITGHTVKDTIDQIVEYKQDGSLSDWRFAHESKTSAPQPDSKDAIPEPMVTKERVVEFNDGVTPILISEGDISVPASSSTGDIYGKGHKVDFTIGKNKSQSITTYSSNNPILQSTPHQKLDITYSEAIKKFIIDAEEFAFETVEGVNPEIIDVGSGKLKPKGTEFKEVHIDRKSKIVPTKAAMVTIAAAVSIATAGICASAGAATVAALGVKSAIAAKIISGATSAAVSSAFQQATFALANSGGDIAGAAKELASTDTLKRMVMSTVMSALLAGNDELLTQMGIPLVQDANNLAERLLFAGSRQFSQAIVKTCAEVISGVDPKDVMNQNLKNSLASTIGIAGSSEIGNAYGKRLIDPISHKGLHGLLGFVEGFIMGGDAKSALSGAVGSIVAETIADLLSPKILSLEDILSREHELDRPLTNDEFAICWAEHCKNYMQNSQYAANTAKLLASVTALLTYQDVETAQFTSGIAIDNNYDRLVCLTICTLFTAHSLYRAYQDGGQEAFLNQLVIEAATYGIGFGISRLAGPTGKIAARYQIKDKIFYSAEQAISYLLNLQPELKLALSAMKEHIGPVAHSLKKAAAPTADALKLAKNKLKTALGKAAAPAASALNTAANKFNASTIGKGLSAVDAKLIEMDNFVDRILHSGINKVMPGNVVEAMTPVGFKVPVSLPEEANAVLSATLKQEANIATKAASSGVKTESQIFSSVEQKAKSTLKTEAQVLTEQASHFPTTPLATESQILSAEQTASSSASKFSGAVITDIDTVKTVRIPISGSTTSEIEILVETLENRTLLDIKHPVLDNIKTGSGLKIDECHGFDPVIDNFARYAQKFTLDNDYDCKTLGIVKEFYQIEGSLNGKVGVFEWIVDPRPEKGVTHRFFYKNGTITGKPNGKK